MNRETTLSTHHFDALSRAVASSQPSEGLTPEAYARDHAAFERRSDQRGLIANWLVDRLAKAPHEPLSVLSVGCGAGELDAMVARRLLAGPPRQRAVRYVGVEPFDGSAQRFVDRMEAIEDDRLSVEVHREQFAAARLDETFDAITFVHSMYYVPDVLAAVKQAASLLRDGGEVLVLSAPVGELNRLADLLAPRVEGNRQWFSDDVRTALEKGDVDFVAAGTIDAVLDLTDADDGVLDFTVQAHLSPELRILVRQYLAEISLVPGRSVVAHPVDCYAVAGGSGREIGPSPERWSS